MTMLGIHWDDCSTSFSSAMRRLYEGKKKKKKKKEKRKKKKEKRKKKKEKNGPVIISILRRFQRNIQYQRKLLVPAFLHNLQVANLDA